MGLGIWAQVGAKRRELKRESNAASGGNWRSIRLVSASGELQCVAPRFWTRAILGGEHRRRRAGVSGDQDHRRQSSSSRFLVREPACPELPRFR